MELSNEKKIAVLKKIFEQDILSFARFFYPHHLKLEVPEFHKEILGLYLSDKDRVAVVAPRGHAKSTLTDLVYLSWAILHKKANFVLLVSDTFSQAVMFLDALKAEFEANDKLKAFYDLETNTKWSEKEIIVNGVMVKALGAGNKVRGLKFGSYRPDLVIVDDLENDEMVESIARREKLARWFNGALVPSLAPEGRLLMIGTILHYDSLLYNILDKEKYPEFETKLYKAIMNNKALWPEHLSLEKLDELKGHYIAKGEVDTFHREYMNEPISGQNRKFKIEKLKYYTDEDIKYKELKNYMTIDRAYSLDKTADFTGIVIVGVDKDNNWFVRHAERFKRMEKDLIEKIFELKEYYEIIDIGIEQKAFEYTIKPALKDAMQLRNKFFSVKELKDGGRSKEMRIEGLLPRYEMGTIYLKREQKDLIDEMYMFPRGTHDDLCLVGETLVATPFGEKQIKDIKIGDYVLTPFGKRKVIASACTGTKEVIENVGLTGLPEHKIFAGNKFDNLDTITYIKVSFLTLKNIIIWRYKNLLNSMESNTGLWVGRENIILLNQKQMREEKVLKDFMWRFGNFITRGKLTRAIQFTIKMAALLIMTYLTWSVFKLGNIYQSILRKIGKTKSLGSVVKSTLMKLGRWLVLGIGAKRDENGTENTEQILGKTIKSMNSNAKCVEKNSSHHLNELDFAEKIVKCKVGEKEILKGGDKSKKKVDLRKVYNIKVAIDGVYYANGVLVSNCDALSYQLTLAQAPTQKVRQFIPKY